MYIRTGLAPISDESAHNQGKKEKNLKNSYQVKQCFKKYKKLKTQCNLLRDDVFPYFSIRVVSEKTFLQMSDYFYFIYGDAVFIVSKKCICVKQLSVCLLYGGKADAHLKSLHTYSLCYNRETSKANTDVQTFIRDAKLLCQVGVISKDRYKINDLFHNRKEDEFMKTKVFIDGRDRKSVV